MIKKGLLYLITGVFVTWFECNYRDGYNFSKPYWHNEVRNGLITAVIASILGVLLWPIVIALAAVDMINELSSLIAFYRD